MSLRACRGLWIGLLMNALSAFAVLLACSTAARAQDHIVEKYWLEDPSGQLKWPEVRQEPMQPFHGVLSRGYGQAVIWIRLRIDPGANDLSRREPERLILRIRPTYLDDIQVYDPLEPTGFLGATGDQHHPGEQAYEGLDFTLPITRGQEPRDIWLRLQSTSTRQISVQAVGVDDLNRLQHIQELLFALYVGTIVVFMAWALTHWLFSREAVIGIFAITQITALLYALCSSGYSRVFWPEFWSARWLDLATSAFSIVAVSSAVLFHVVFISEFGPPRWMRKLMKFFPFLLPIKLILLLSDQVMRALHINMLEILIAPVVFLAAVLLAKGWEHPDERQRPTLDRHLVIGFYVVLWGILLAAVLPGLALTEGAEISLYIIQTHGLLTAFLILLMLQYRAHVRRRIQDSMALALERSQLQALQEKSMREEQGQLLTMLTHELKTPLATMHMRLDNQSQGSKEIRQAIRDMNAVIERCVQSLQLSDQRLVAEVGFIDAIKVIKDAIAACAQPDRISLNTPATLQMTTDPQLLSIILTNLLENACKYAAPNTPIVLQVETGQAVDPSGLNLLIANQPGPAGHPNAEKVFDKYYRSSHARRQAGTGLGLFLVRHLAQVMGGKIEYLPDQEMVRFRLHLPSLDSSRDLV